MSTRASRHRRLRHRRLRHAGLALVAGLALLGASGCSPQAHRQAVAQDPSAVPSAADAGGSQTGPSVGGTVTGSPQTGPSVGGTGTGGIDQSLLNQMSSAADSAQSLANQTQQETAADPG